jgi:hypothetical protein
MKIVCLHCQEAGESWALREHEPYGDPRITYALCPAHRHKLEAEVAKLRAEAQRRQPEGGWVATRRFERFLVALPARCWAAQFPETALRGVVHYVSAGGLMVELPVEVVSGSTLRVVLHGRHGPVEVHGRVVWTSATGDTVRHGLAFPEPQGPGFIEDFVIEEES